MPTLLPVLKKSFENQNYEKTVELIPTETLMMELASRMKGYTITVSEKSDIKKSTLGCLRT
ncbi:hypothetical protein [Acinetobacter baumannii]|uniref:hypothetical protein n=1 Tax=Acinetobacter baumannii TaxID=470 RepID=UPI002074F420|nr:hypothetical protein [Acinetobacter baumannii]